MSSRASTRDWQRNLYASDDDDDDKKIDPLVKKYADEVQMNARHEIDSAHKHTFDKKIRLEQQKRSWRCPFQNSRTKFYCTEVRTDHRGKDSIYCRKHKPVMKKRKETEDKKKAELQQVSTCGGEVPKVPLTIADFYKGDKTPVTPTDMDIDPPVSTRTSVTTAVAIAVPVSAPATPSTVDDNDDELERRFSRLNSTFVDYDAQRLREKRANAPADSVSSSSSSSSDKEAPKEALKKESKEEVQPKKLLKPSPKKSPKKSPVKDESSVPIDYVTMMFQMLAKNPHAFKPMMDKVIADYGSKKSENNNNEASSEEDEIEEIDVTGTESQNEKVNSEEKSQNQKSEEIVNLDTDEEKDPDIQSFLNTPSPQLERMFSEIVIDK